MKKLLLIGRTIENILNDIPLEFDIVHITREKDIKYGTKVFNRPTKTVLMDYENTQKLVEFCKNLHELEHFDCVYSFSEEGLIPSANISKELNIPGPDLIAVENTKNKLIMRKKLERFPSINLDYQELTSFEQVIPFLSKHKHIILKPVDGFGSQGVIKVSEYQNAREAFDYCQSYSKSIIMEEFSEGKQISVETFSENGKHTILAVTEKTMCNPPYCVSLSQLMPAKLTDSQSKMILESTLNLLNTVNYKFGPAHIELSLTEKSVKVIEIQTRPGGRIHDMLKFGLGFNIFSLTLNRLFQQPYIKKEAPGASSLFYIIAKPGIISNIQGIDKLKKHPNVKSFSLNVNLGDKVEPLINTGGRIGHFICVGSKTEEVYDIGSRLLEEIEITTK